MATFIMRRPFAIASTLAKELPKASTLAKELPKASTRTTFRSFQTSTRTTTQQQNLFRSAFRQSRSKRGYQTSAPPNPVAQGSLTQRLIYGGAIFGGTVLAVNLVFNRETREDGMSYFLNQSIPLHIPRIVY
jgi:hypothetical protein